MRVTVTVEAYLDENGPAACVEKRLPPRQVHEHAATVQLQAVKSCLDSRGDIACVVLVDVGGWEVSLTAVAVVGLPPHAEVLAVTVVD